MYSPLGPATDAPVAMLAAKVAAAADPEGTFVRFIAVSTPVRASYAAQQEIPPVSPKGPSVPPIEYGAISRPLGRTPC